MKIITFIKNHKILTFLIFMALTVLSAILFAIELGNQLPESSISKNDFVENRETKFDPNDQVSFKEEIKPGTTEIEELNDKLGKPDKTFEENDYIVNEYKTENPYLFTKAYSKNGEVELIVEPIDFEESRMESVIYGNYGKPEYTLYNQNDPTDPFNLYVYTTNGFAYEGHEDGTVLRVWYFQPTSLPNFINNYAKNYATSPSTKQHY